MDARHTLPDMKTIGQRLRELREAPGGMSQEDLGRKLERNQRWVSERERGVVVPTVDEAAEIARVLGYVGEFVILPASQEHLLRALASADPKSVALALRLLVALPHLNENVADMVGGIVESAERAAHAATG